jgi:uncharacterized surface protein with fasciclin (FAS1) repeats
MYRSKDIVANAMDSKDHTTLVAAVKAAGLVSRLKGPGPFTVFAPTNAAFDKLPEGTVEMLLEPEHLDQPKPVLTYHVVPGRLDSKMLMEWAHKWRHPRHRHRGDGEVARGPGLRTRGSGSGVGSGVGGQDSGVGIRSPVSGSRSPDGRRNRTQIARQESSNPL